MKYSAFIGRMQLPHNGQLQIIKKALEETDALIVVLGSSFKSRTPKNPFTWEERADMIKLSLGDLIGKEGERIHFIPMRDYYDDDKWAFEVKKAVLSITNGKPVSLYGHKKDVTGYYQDNFSEWEYVDAGHLPGYDSSNLRKALFSVRSPSSAMSVISHYTSQPIIDYLTAWSELPYRADMIEYKNAVDMDLQKFNDNINVSADAILTCADKILVMRRRNHPGKNTIALPGGFVERNEKTLQAALRELEEETTLKIPAGLASHSLVDCKVYDDPMRSERKRIITHAYHFDLNMDNPPEVRSTEEAKDPFWLDFDAIDSLESEFFEDHFMICKTAIENLSNKNRRSRKM